MKNYFLHVQDYGAKNGFQNTGTNEVHINTFEFCGAYFTSMHYRPTKWEQNRMNECTSGEKASTFQTDIHVMVTSQVKQRYGRLFQRALRRESARINFSEKTFRATIRPCPAPHSNHIQPILCHSPITRKVTNKPT